MNLRNFVFTINNYTDSDILSLKSLPYSYIIYGKEKVSTPHLQGYCELNKQVKFKTVKDIIPRAHIEIRKGTQIQAINYCKKDGDYTELGTPKSQGHRADLDNIREVALEDGMTMVTCIGNAQQIRVAKDFLTYNEPGRNWEMDILWLTGPSGCGKSKLAHELAPDAYCKDGSKWWDGYDAHEDIIIDDFRDSWWDLTFMLKLLDRYPLRVECKGGYRQIRAKRIIITSIKHPTECYLNTGECKKQLLRRVTKIETLGAPVPEVKRLDACTRSGGNTRDPTSESVLICDY